jgi:cell division protein FtsX
MKREMKERRRIQESKDTFSSHKRMLNRIFSNTKKQIARSGWVAWSSVDIMALAFFVATIFGGLDYLSNLFIQFVVTKDNVLVFFEVGIDQKVVSDLKERWENLSEIKKIDFTSEEEAYALYLAETEYTMPVEHELLQEFDDDQRKLPSSLDIQTL